MGIDQTLLTLFQELMAEYDPDIDTSEGSTFYMQVMYPLLTRVGGSPLDEDLETFLVNRVQEIYGNELDVSAYAGLRDLLIRPAVTIFSPLLREIEGVKITQSMENYEQMTRDELNALLANYFVSMQDGDYATTTVRLYFLSPQSLVLTPLTKFSTGGNLNFFPTVTQSISSTQMAFNQDGSLYYFDVTVQSESTGSNYNVKAGDINSVYGVSGVVRVSNLSDIDDGNDEESKEEAVIRAQESITIRNLSVERGVEFVIAENFSWADTIQVIGKGDDEMERDILQGPIDIGGIPGGIAGKVVPNVSSGAEVHIGGFTDVYLYQETPVSDSIDIYNLTDWGYRIYAGTTGYTDPGSSTTIFKDDYGLFSSRGVLVGDILRVGEVVAHVVTVSEEEIEVDVSLDEGMYDLTYEIVRKENDHIIIPLYDLVAEQDDSPYLEGEDPVQAEPGSVDKEPLLDDLGDPVLKTENIAVNNLTLPLLRAVSVDFLDELSGEVKDIQIPMADILLITAKEDFTGGGPSSKATGTVRLYFRDAVNVWVKYGYTRFTRGPLSFRPTVETTGSAEVTGAGDEILLLGADYTAEVTAGTRIAYRGSIYMATEAVYDSTNTVVTVREEFTVGSFGTFTLHKGITGELIEQDEDTGLYVYEVAVEATQNGTSGNIAAGTELQSRYVNVEGWNIYTTFDVVSFSTRELPCIRFSDWVCDDIDLSEISTAYAVRITYDEVSKLADVQDFVEDEQNRIVAEDVLVRHFLPAYIRGEIVSSYNGDEAVADLKATINALDPASRLELSDLVKLLSPDDATAYVQLPVTLVALEHHQDRTWHATITQDYFVANRVQHFIADSDNLSVTAPA